MKKNNFILSGIAISIFCASGSVLSKGHSNGSSISSLPSPSYDFRVPGQAKIELGRNLMFDKILSGNMMWYMSPFTDRHR